MLLPLYHFPIPSSFTTTLLFPFPSPFLSPHQTPKPSKFTIHSSTTTTSTTTLSKTALRRIAEKLRNLGYIEEEKDATPLPKPGPNSPGQIFLPLPTQLPKHRPGYTIDSSWSTPENPVPEPGSGAAISRFHILRHELKMQKKRMGKREPKEAPTLAELSVPAEELRRLKTVGIGLRKKLNVGKAGVTEGIVNGIHERWRRSEVVKIKCEDLCKLNMKRTHDILERKTGGLVIWRSGSTIILYRGANYKYPYFLADIDTTDDTTVDESLESSTDHGVDDEKHGNLLLSKGVSSRSPTHNNGRAHSSLVQGVGSLNKVRFQLPGEAQLAEEGDHLLHGLGPRFTDWWGCDPLPVDADLLPAVVPRYRRPFRLLPYGLKAKLTDDEMTTLRRLGRHLPCHFALGRNRNLQGLAVSIIKLWEKCEIAKVAVKRGVQNTSSEMMAEEIKRLTGGTLLSRDRDFIVFYRGKDFLPPAVSTAIEERRNHGLSRNGHLGDQFPSLQQVPKLEVMTKGSVSADTHMNEQKNMELVSEKKKLRSRSTSIKRISTSLSMALEKKAKAEELLEELEKAAETQEPEMDKEGITEEERFMLRKVGLRMKPFLLLGRRGVFDGTVENMHLHWKYRELVKIISGERCIEDIHGAARTLEAESGGILVAVERVNSGYAIIVYRGKNYQRPADLRPRTLLNKKQAMKRSIEAQRRQSLKLHVLSLTKNIDQLKRQMAKDDVEMSCLQSNESTRIKADPQVTGCAVKVSRSQNNADSVELGDDRRGTSLNASDSTPSSLQSNCSIDVSCHSEGTIQMNMPIDSNLQYNESGRTELNSSTDSEIKEKCSGTSDDEAGESTGSGFESNPGSSQTQDEVTYSAIDITEAPVSGTKLVTFFAESTKLVTVPLKEGKFKFKPSVDRENLKVSDMEVPSRAEPLSNRDRLLLRKQALKMKKRPVLAVGRSNLITGVAKAIKTHFIKNPLAIVNLKGRAKGTSIQELVSKLEKATGAVMVSQEPNKVILYRGWGEDRGGVDNKRTARTMTDRERTSQEVVSPQLLEAIRLECGLLRQKEEIL